MQEFIVDVTPQNAQQVLLDESFNRPVVVDFWADWCEPCKVLTPIMEKLAREYQGQFLLAKVNADQQQGLATQLGIRSLPTIMVFRDGQPVDGFSGALPEGEIRSILEPHLPKPWDEQLAQARALMQSGQFGEALPLLRQARESAPRRSDIALELARVLLELNRLDDAEELLKAIPMVDQDGHYRQLLAQVELKRQAAKTPEIEALEARLREHPDDLNAAYQLALQFEQGQHHKECMGLLFEILQKNRNFLDGAVKKTLLNSIASLGKGDPLAAEYQRKLFGLLY